jgi:hypothetical protein
MDEQASPRAQGRYADTSSDEQVVGRLLSDSRRPCTYQSTLMPEIFASWP